MMTSTTTTTTNDLIREEREQAWIGDAVLGLFARQWILRTYGSMDSALFTGLTSNHFLSCFGNPTAVEAKIGNVFQASGLDAAFAHIESELVPLFQKQQKNRVRK
jgi:dsRNA-specific ribonuclease